MKKLLIVALSVMVSACACFECEREAQMASYPETRMAQPDCDYFDGKTCYRYVYRNTQRPAAKPAARRSACLYGQKAKSPSGYQQVKGSCGCGNSCETKISETREPVEIVYKKTTYKTVYEPKTYSQVSYEKVPYNQEPERVEVVDDNEILLQEVK